MFLFKKSRDFFFLFWNKKMNHTGGDMKFFKLLKLGNKACLNKGIH